MLIANSKRAVLFGGAGFIGSHLVNALVHDGWKITVVTRRPHRHRDLLVIPSLRMVETGDLSSEYIASLIEEADTVVNLIGILNQSRADTFAEIHTSLPERIANACLQKNARKLIHISALGASVDAPSEYLKSRGRAEQALQAIMEQGLDCTIIRPSIVFGPEDSFSRMFQQFLALAPVFFALVSPNARVQPVYVVDLVECIVHAINAKTPNPGCFDVAGPKTYELREFIELIDRLSGMRHRIIGLNPFLSRLLATFTQFAPGKPLTPDNLLSLQAPGEVRENTPEPYGVQQTRFESVAESWLGSDRTQFDKFRTQAGR